MKLPDEGVNAYTQGLAKTVGLKMCRSNITAFDVNLLLWSD
jgi:hypothetical protein